MVRFGDIDGPCYVVPYHSSQSCGQSEPPPRPPGVDCSARVFDAASEPVSPARRPGGAPMEESTVRISKSPRTRPRASGNPWDGIGRLAAILVALVLVVAACGPAGGSAAPTSAGSVAPSVAPSDGAEPSGSPAAEGLQPPATKVDLVV